MRIETFLAELIEKKIHITSSDGELSVKVQKGNLDQKMIEEIRERKAEIVAYLEGLKENAYHSIPAIAKENSYAISDAQRRLYVLCQIDQGATLYTMSNSVFLSGDFDRQSFYRAVTSTINRHEILRTIFREDEQGEIRQWIIELEDLNFTIDYQDFQVEDGDQMKVAVHVQEYINQDSLKQFDLEKGPLIRAALLRCGEDHYMFHYTMHHIISDGWSLDVLENDLLEFYHAFRENRQPELEPLKIHYKDYAAWQLNKLDDDEFQQSRKYWLQKLKGNLPLLDLPTSLKRPAMRSSQGQKVGMQLSPDLTQQIRTFVNTNGGSLFMTTFACFNVLMYRYTSLEDIIIGTPVAGRNHADLENQIGFYVNTLALRNQINPDDSFNDFYETIKETTFESFKHQMYPFDRLFEELTIQRDFSQKEVFDIFFTTSGNKTDLGNLGITQEGTSHVHDFGECAAKFNLEIILQEFENYLSLSAVFNHSFYEVEMVVALLQHYERLLMATLISPEKKIAEINYLSQEEERELLLTFNEVQREPPYTKMNPLADRKMTGKNMLDLFDEQVKKNPQSVAVLSPKASNESLHTDHFYQLTYQQLDNKSNQFANFLRLEHDVKPRDFVTVFLERSEWLIVATLAVLKLGATYIPVDTEYPESRVAFIVEDSQSKLVVDSELLHKFIQNCSQFSEDLTKDLVLPNDLAYVIYTSGSTGTPKGVMIEHQSLSSFLEDCTKVFHSIAEIG